MLGAYLVALLAASFAASMARVVIVTVDHFDPPADR